MSATQTKTAIVKVMFTFACVGGLWTLRANGKRQWEPYNLLRKEFGQEELRWLCKTAHADGLWYSV